MSYTAPGPVPSTAALEALWQAWSASFDGGIYDLGDLATDTDAGAAVILSRPGEWQRRDAEAGAHILNHLGYAAQQHYHTTPPLGWTIKVRRDRWVAAGSRRRDA